MFYIDLSEYDCPESEEQLQEKCSLKIKFMDNQGMCVYINEVRSRRPPASLIVSRRVGNV